ncbi:MAG TPA: hypothetical protein VGK30_08680, partial [Candidatus Binatia bacterium]
CLTAGPAQAQCAFGHPRSAKKLSTSLVQAFYYCGDRGFSGDVPPNTTTEGSVPACKPPSPASDYDVTSWRWSERVGRGEIALKAVRTFPVDPLNPPSNSADVTVLLKMEGLVDRFNERVDGRSGFLSIIARITMDDRADGDVTMVDGLIGAPVDVVMGKAKLVTSLDAMLNASSFPGLPTCSSLEIADILVLDHNGYIFARSGLFLDR